jgi:hypothetical protein
MMRAARVDVEADVLRRHCYGLAGVEAHADMELIAVLPACRVTAGSRAQLKRSPVRHEAVDRAVKGDGVELARGVLRE